ncbi:MAG: non-canonical purine NTP pyrophosphatase [Actinobacteria bacterium]|nr:non-canonical purine NTP pyrophosphatase [Actinomycetota bacterium]
MSPWGARLEVILASSSAHKLAEYQAIFAGSPVILRPAPNSTRDLAIEESGATYRENARVKAQGYARALGRWALADDSGLEVDALGGQPGVRSHRFAGPSAGDVHRNQHLLGLLAGVPAARRTARYRCVVAVARPDGVVAFETEATCEGVIAILPRGAQGFGYDPLFEFAGSTRTMAELTPAEKNSLSHRGKAGLAARRFLEAFPTDR